MVAGFSPRPLLSFGLALPTGCESLAEYLDVRLTREAPAPGSLDQDACERAAARRARHVGRPPRPWPMAPSRSSRR